MLASTRCLLLSTTSFNNPNRLITSGGLGTMGFGFPAAMGIKQNFPDDDVVCVTGEGSFQMMMQELSTCKQYGVGVQNRKPQQCIAGHRSRSDRI